MLHHMIKIILQPNILKTLKKMVHNKLVKSFSDIKTQRVAAYTPGRFPLSKADG